MTRVEKSEWLDNPRSRIGGKWLQYRISTDILADWLGEVMIR
jgi:hypothetical protein